MTRFRYLLGLFFLVGPAFAYLLSEWTPQGGAPITWNVSMQQPSAYFNGGSLQYRIITSGPHAITDAARHSNIENAFQSWQDVPDAVIAFTRGPDGTDDTGFSVAYATATGDTQWGGNLAGAAGLASINFVGNEIVDADIAFALLNPGTTSAWGEELEATAVHEGGHAIALEHTPHAQSPMSYIGPIAGTNDQNVGRRLTSDDILALAFAYPNAGYLDSVGSIGGTIEAGPGNPVHKAQIGVFDSSDILVTTTLSRLGQYKVEGLPPGSYTLRAYPSQTVSALIQQDSTLPWTADGLATQFLIGTDQSTTVTAGNTATLNLTVTPGTPTMVSAFGYRDIGGALRAGGFVFTLDRGETGTLGLGGTNFPTQASEFSAFQLSGPPDVLLNNQAFPGWPNNTVNAYDFAVDPAAALGARALMLERDTNEKTVVWGFLEVTDTGAISAASGTNNPASSTINPDTRKVMQQFAMSATATEMVRLRQLTVSNSGSGSTNRVIGVEIFADAAGNGFLDGDDMLIGTANFGGGSTTQIFAHHTIKAGSTENFLVVYQFDGTVVSSETYRSSITAAMTSGVVSGRDIAPTGLPRNGNTHTVEGFNEHTATFGISGNGFLIGPILQLVPNGGSTLGVSPVADTNHYFAGWSGDVQNFDDPLFITNVSSDLVVTANFSYGIANFPYSESFEGAFGVWENIAEDNFDWTRQAGPTPSSPTGPDAASEGNFYVFTDAFGHVPSQTAIIRAPFSFANLGNPKIAFDYHMYGADMGTLFLESSTNGGETWNTVWSKSGDQGNAWHSATVSLAALAGTLNVQLQFRAVMGTGTGYLGDIAIDAITVSDDQALSLVISQAAISENGGVSLATVTRSGDTTNALNVNLSSNNTDAATVPVSINIPAAQTSATFNVTAVDDNLLDGTQTVTIEATATNFAAGQDSIEVTDEEALSLAINLGAIPENGGVSFATVTRHNSDIGAALNVNLASSDTSEATVPVTVTIPAAQGSATFDISAVDDNLLDGTQTVTITATNTSYAIFGQETIDILDHETLTVHVFETAISEADGTSVATVVRTGGTDGPLTVTLSSDDVSEAQVPFDVTIADGDTSASFTVVAQDDLEVDGPQTVTINALHEAYVSVPDTVAVTDHEQLIVNINFLNMPENDGFTRPTITVDRTDLDGNLPITLTSSDISEATVAPTNFTILNGNVSATSTLSAVDDNLLDGPQTVIVTASAPGYIDGQATIDILDHETIDLIAPNPNPISEKGGVSQAQLVRSATNVVSTVSLTSSDTSEATVPATYSFLVGEASTTITITAVDDSILDGFQNVTITPSAAGYFATQNFIGIEDYETLTVNIVFDSISENGGTSQATVTRSTGTAGNLVVDLINVDPSETSTPFQVTIPDGSSSAVFTVTGFDDFDLDGTQTVQIDAGAAGYIGVPDSVDVTDYEELNVYVWMPSVFENDPTQVVFEANRVDNNGDLAVTLSSNDPSEGSVPASFTILDGEYSATSVFTAIDDTILDGPQTVTITLSAVGYADAQGTIEVLDVEDLSVQVTETEMSEFGGSSNAIVKRHNTDIGAALTVMLHSDQAGDEANVPFDITIPAGQSTAAFTVIAVDDALVDGTQIATIGASHESYANSTPDSIAVTDHEELLLTLDFLTLSEDGAPTSRLTVTRTDTTGALLVNLHSDDTSETSVPPSFTIADGMASGTSILTTVDDSLLDGTQTVTLTASAAGYISASKNLAVTDDAVTVTMVADPAAGGNVSGPGAVDPDAGPFAISATPNPGYTFEFWATTDGGTEGNFLDGLTANATVTATFNHCPVANDDSGTVGEDDVRNVPAPGLVGNDVDNNDPLFILSYTQPAKGSVTVATNGAFVYDTLGEFDFLAVGKTATDHFTYTLDDEVCSSVASVVVIVHGVNDCPQALADSASTPEDQQASGNVLFNDSDIDDELLTASNAEGAIGQVTLAADGAFSYNPNGEFDALNFGETATDSFTYTLSDGTCTVVGTVAIVVFGEETLQVSIAASSLREDFQSSIVTVSRAGTVGDLFVSLSSSDISEATVTSFTILDGANSATGVITTVDDSELDGTQTVTIIASAPGYKDGVDSIDVTDHETLALDPALLDPLTENGGATTTMAVFRSASAGTQVINLLSSDISEVTVPATYTFSDGSSTGTIVLTAVDDTLLDGTQTATISISAAGYLGATQPVDIADHETLSVTIAEISMSEAGGSSSAFVSRNNSDIAAPLTVDLFVDDPSEGFVPFQVIIPANSKSETFTVTAQDDFELDGTQTLTVSAAHESYEPPADDSILVTDSEGLTIAPDISGLPENGGANTIVRVFRTDTNGPLAVTLNHNDASEVSLNRTNFTILDGEPAGTAVLTAVDDSILDGTQTVTLTATAPGYGNGEFPYEIFDHETLSLAIADFAISEFGGSTTATVTRNNTDIASAYTITLTSYDTSAATVPPTVEIPAGQASAKFTITAVDDSLLDGTQSVTVEVSAFDYVGDSQSLDVTDYEKVYVSVVPGSISENGGTAVGTVTRTNTDNAAPLLVDLASDDESEATVPAQVTIPPAEGSTTFLVTAQDDNDVDGTKTATITPTAPNYLSLGFGLDVTDDAVTVTMLAVPAGGGSVDGPGTVDPDAGPFAISATPNPGYTFDFWATTNGGIDGNELGGLSDDATVTGHFNPCPTAVDDKANTQEDAPAFVGPAGVLINDIDDDPLRVIAHSQGLKGGMVSVHSNGAFTYNPLGHFQHLDDSETATDTFTYVVSDGECTDVGTVVMIIQGRNDCPLAVADSATTDEATPVSGDVEANDIDIDGDTLTASNPQGMVGLVTLLPNGNFTYDPNGQFDCVRLGQSATDSFTYVISDGDCTDVGTVVITIHGLRDTVLPSITCPDDITVDNDEGICGAVVTYTPPTGSDNCPGAITTQIAGLGSGATFPIGSTTETYQVTDAAGNSSTCSFTITVNDAEAPVITCPDDITVDNDAGICGAVVTYTPPTGSDNCPGAVTTQIAGLGSGATFPTGRTTEIYEVTDASGNSTTCSFTVTVVGCPSDIAVVITETAISEAGGVATGLVTRSAAGPAVTVTLINSDPTAATAPATVTIPLGQISAPFTINAINDARLDGTQSLTITPQTGGVNGIHDNLDILDDAVTINMAVVPAGSGTASGPGTVDPDGGPFAISATANGTHVFTGWSTTHGSITGNQIDGLTANATVTAHFNGRPIVVDDSYTTLEDTPLTGDVSDNDSDPEGDPTTYHLVSRSGQLTLNTDGSFSYLPAPDFNGRVAFTYRANDGADSANNATITIDVLPVNDCPVADDQAIVLGEDDDVRGQLTAFDADGPLVGVIGSARSYDAVPTASTQSVDAVGTASYARSGPFSTHAPPAHGALEIDPDGSFTYATLGAFNHLAVGETATDAFTFLVTDGECSDIGTVVLTIHGANDLPTTVADSATTDEDTAFVFDLLANDEDVDSPLSLVSWTSPNYDGTTYTPVPDFHGEETFVYEVNDGVTGVATVVIRPINDPPVNTALPAITGIAASGETVGVTPGVWNDDDDLVPGTITLSYQWLRDGTDIPGASGSSYTLVDADVGTALSVRETATNTGEGTPVTVTASAESPAREVGWRVHIGTIARAGSVTFGMSSGASVGADAFDTADDTPPLTLHNLGLTLSADWRPIADSASWLLHSDSFDELVLNFTASALPGDRYLSIYEVRGEFDLEPTGASAARLEGDGSFVVPPGPRWFLIRYGSSLSSIYIFRPGYNLISFPYQPDGNARGIFIQDGQHVDLGDLTYVFGGEDRLAGAVEAYRGYWLFTPRREIVRVEGIPAPRRLTIAPGWNSIGVDVEMGLPWALRSRLHFWSYGFRKTNRLIPQRGYLADFADSELSW